MMQICDCGDKNCSITMSVDAPSTYIMIDNNNTNRSVGFYYTADSLKATIAFLKRVRKERLALDATLDAE